MMKKNIFLMLLSGILFSWTTPGTETVVIRTTAICGMCKVNLERSFAFAKGVKGFDLDRKTGDVTVTYNPDKTDPESIRKVISKAGYDADHVKRDPEAFEKLDDCCKLPRDQHH